MKPRALVVGGGLHGACAAMHLASSGFDVTVIEKQYAGRHASGVNAGGVRRLGRHPAEIPLAVAALERWQRLEALIGDNGGFHACGQIKVAENVDEMTALEARAAQVRELGFDHEILLSRAELRRRVPAIASHCVGALACDGDGAADPYRTLTAWRRRSQRKGARWLEGVRVTNIETIRSEGWRLWTDHSDFRCLEGDWLINCAGGWAGELSQWLGERVELEPRALMMTITERISPFLVPVIGAAGRALSFKQRENGTVMIGGGLFGSIDTDGESSKVNFRRLAKNIESALALFPFMRETKIIRNWTGIEGVTIDGLPVLGNSARYDRLIHSFGYSAHGFQLSAITGEIVRDLACEREPKLPITPFAIQRFDTPRSTARAGHAT
ncbi:NAD(P)/FAD-dependent oxidoreductase [Salinicola rhizosphaerae]|uniref:Sarcosine oxidase subunit beta n=1 Tax=Salinicola rhizosphaerae TaxID=1443141 RepID=A0ABQ3E266_9GAMM|nr:FAD-dependent oxidoreductase [Salinicola rhizosphaerae]GHB23788.1 sarcosine oxidase subunit beta [Salinicola rhizosphaerae]